ncbi:right-handed parallel beta-helix repeat-containing protein [Bosea sp. BK604]|uniref:right-handed parallel beta-helix repeat-containing protein n=1 Tax=Bosea sp. BK604 TaxID=2512180 RepID=UPI0010455F98|nr:right-handed parallel beta-helix repeat-containing protein [Bosea sp. BK604]TCR62597.1 parallel beta helix pectate lyase-like protein [Bosea sp. BK604]
MRTAGALLFVVLGGIPLRAQETRAQEIRAQETGAQETIGEACPADALRIRPDQSLGMAVNLNPPGASFCILAGLHRLEFATPKTGQSFFGEPGAILSGAKILTGFKQVGQGWAAPSEVVPDAKARGVCARGYEACRLAVGVFVDGVPLRQVASRELLRAGSFFHDRVKRQIVLSDPPGEKLVEVAVVPFAFQGSADKVTIRGLVIEKYANPPQEGAVRGDGRGWRVEKSELRLNNGAGVSVGPDGAIVKSRIHHNGQIGATADGANILLEGNEIWSNNIYGFDPSWDAGGVKITVSSQVVFRDNHVHHNNGPGLWCDERCEDVLFEGNLVEFNQSAGIFFELSSRAVIRRNTLRENNQAGASWFWGAEIQIAASDYAEIYENTLIVRDSGRGVMLIDQNRWKVGGGFYKTQGNRVHHNDVTFLGTGATGGVSSSDPAAENFAIIAKGGNTFDHNTYRVLGSRAPIFAWDTAPMDFASFRSRGQEPNGRVIAGAPRAP